MKQIRTLLGIICAIATCFTQTTARAEGHHQSGISGQVILGKPGPAGLSVQCLISIESESGKTDQIIQTDEDGVFWLALKPGKYFLTPFTHFGLYPGILVGPEVTVIVDKKSYSDIQLTIPLAPVIRPPIPITPIIPPDGSDPGSGWVGILPIIPIIGPGGEVIGWQIEQ